MNALLKKVLLLSVATMSPFVMSAQEASRHAFATYNVRYTNDSSGENQANNAEGKSWDLRGPYVIQIVENYDFDIVGFQEVTGRNGKYCMSHGTGMSQLETLKYELSDYSFFEYERDGAAAGKDYSYNAIAYKTERYEALENGVFWISPTPNTPSNGWDPDYTIRRTCGWAKMKEKSTGDTFIFAVTHCNYGPSLDGPNGGRLIVDRLSAIAGDLPVVLLGDFNMRSSDHHDAYREYTTYFSHARTSADKSICVPEANGQIEWTTTGWTTADKATSGSEFDHIFYRGMHAHNCYVITENFGRGINPSDHYPVLCEFTLGNDMTDLYVDASAVAGGNGTTDAPFTTIAEAVNIARAGATIYVTAGTYNEQVTFTNPINVIGGYDSAFENVVGKTIFDGASEGSRLIVSKDAGVHLENIKISNAKSTIAGNDGALYTTAGSLYLKNVEFEGNEAYSYGGGIYSTASDVYMESCSFIGNNAPVGAAAYLLSLVSLKVTGSTFMENECTKNGTLYVASTGDSYLWNNTFANNSLNAKKVRQAALANSYGGSAVYADLGDDDTPILFFAHNTIVGNNSTYTGTATDFFGAALNIDGGTTSFVNNIIAGNATTADDGYGDVSVDNVNIVDLDQYNIFSSESTLGFTSSDKNFKTTSFDDALTALAQTLDGKVEDGKFVANVVNNGGLTPTVKPIAQTFAGEPINVLDESLRMIEIFAGTDFNGDGRRSVLAIDQRGELRESTSLPGACEYIDPAAIEDIVAPESQTSITAIGNNNFVIESAESLGKIMVCTLNGAVVFTDQSENNVYALDLSRLNTGIYFVCVSGHASKVIVK